VSALPWEIIAPSGIIIGSAARVVTELIRARTTRRALSESLKDAQPNQRPLIIMALAELLRDERIPRYRRAAVQIGTKELAGRATDR
jgi:hypothetical protein